ncbi:SusC/RagA family TonB-linked outer membrane protein [Paradesertivirga mongoliensis]|uniref:SusC/RagA family TonB-linked outer membrane protein n=1 Tax=Paradesertivirga mongoliensis TaxID=2100740 RepID=A0ABW4ZQH8_9SPHI|nr:TonB-dependent receptor [Pedobacter mongoliensis]
MDLTLSKTQIMGHTRLRILEGGSLKKALLVTKMLSVFLVAGPLELSAKEFTTEKIRSVSALPIRGTVYDENNEPLIGASITVKGTRNSVVADVNGSFTIDAAVGDVLVVSFLGYQDMELKVTDAGTALSVKLQPGDNSLNEVVVVGYGTTKRRDLTGAVSSVKPEEITARPGPNPIESLQGRVAGLDISRSSGQPGEGVSIQLRGNRSIKADGTPLFIINGLPGDYETLNPNDIESIEVLKDASSTAVYGSEGANGVIIITTKSGKAGKLSIDFNSYYGYNGFSVTPKMRTGQSYLEAKRDAYKYTYDATAQKWTTTNALWKSPTDDEAIFGAARYDTFQEGQFVDWADLFLRDHAGTQNYSLGVSGANDVTKGYISFNVTDEKGQYTGDQYKLYSSTMRIDHKIRKWLSIGSNLQGSYVDRDRAQDKLENALVTDPLVRPYKADGSLNPDLGNNVYNLLLNYQPGVYGNVQNNTSLMINPYIEIRPLKGLTFLTRASALLNYNNTYRFDGIGSVAYTYNNSNVARAQIDQNRSQRYRWENILTYNLNLADKHDLTFTGVTSWFHRQSTGTQMNQTNITSNNFQWYNFQGEDNTGATSNYQMEKTLGLMGRVNYSFLGKYLFSASLRRDGASALYKDNQWENFPALSAGWRISDENFMVGTKNWLNNLKLRASWGITGAASIPPYSSVQTMETRDMSLGGVAHPIFRNSPFITNADLRWEKSKSTNVGIDAGLFKNRIDLALDYYNTNTDGVIYNVTSPSIYGTYSPGVYYQTNINVAETNNKGIELTLNTRNIVSRNFEWTSAIAFARNREKIVKLTGGTANNITLNVSDGENRAAGNYSLTIGEPIASFRNFKLDGVWQIGEEADAAVFSKRPGDLKVNVPGMTRVGAGVFVKQAADGTETYYYTNLAEAQKYNPALTAANSRYNVGNNDFQIVGHNTPDWSLGFQNNFKYKGFDLGVYTYFRWGQTINYTMMGWYQPSSFALNASPSRTFPEHFNYWTPENPSNDFPVMNFQEAPSTMTGFSGLSYVDGSFFKIKNITLGYTLPKNIIEKVSMQRMRLYATVTNPLVVAKNDLLKQYDPEMNGELDYPLTKQVVVGLNVTF